ncbi:MAG: hypothetical protein BWY76_01344 [bacterium ADurb.Bin429]|nr:MAG: hypothetical protein BWY76_01344 [bacterium ADurb.Bin429]
MIRALQFRRARLAPQQVLFHQKSLRWGQIALAVGFQQVKGIIAGERRGRNR